MQIIVIPVGFNINLTIFSWQLDTPQLESA